MLEHNSLFLAALTVFSFFLSFFGFANSRHGQESALVRSTAPHKPKAKSAGREKEREERERAKSEPKPLSRVILIESLT